MGIKHLQSFMINCVPNGFIDFSIIEECEAFKKETGNRPIIVIKLMSLFVFVLQKQHEQMLCAGRHNLHKEFFEQHLTKLSKYADLVFFKDGPVQNEKYQKWITRQDERYKTSIDIIKQINDGFPLSDIIRFSKDVPTINTHLPMMESVARRFGKFHISSTHDCDTEIAKYAYEHENVMAVLADDTDYLIFEKGPKDWKYLSSNNLNPITLRTKELSQKALKDYLKLDDSELAILSTLGGNDIIQFEKVSGFQKSLVGSQNYYRRCFPELAKFIRTLPKERDNLIRTIATCVFKNSNESTLKKIEDSLNQYDLHFTPISPENPLLRYCNEKNFEFVASILNRVTKNFPLSYYDMRIRKPNLYNVIVKLFCKQIGIVMMSEENPVEYKIAAKASHQDVFRLHHVMPIKPDGNLPPFEEILKRDEYPQHDEIRFKLLKWMVCENLRNWKLELIPEKYIIDILVLTFMVAEEFIKPFEADIILLSIKQVFDKSVPEYLKPPQVVNGRAFHIAFLFTKLHMLIKRSFEVAGLSHLSSILNFDGVLFHSLYLEHLEDPFDVKLKLGDELIENCCYNNIEN